MIDFFLLNGTSQAFYGTNWLVIVIFEIVTLLLELSFLSYWLQTKKDRKRIDLILGIVIANTLTFLVGTILWFFVTGGR